MVELKTLNLEGCLSLTSLPESLGDLTNLVSFNSHIARI